MLGGNKLKRIVQQYFPPSVERKLKEAYNAVGKYQAYFIRRRICPPYPTYVQIEPTIRCNIACVMCRRHQQLGNMDKSPDMTLSQFKTILGQFPSTNYINLQGNGEPFLNEDIIEMISAAKQKGKYTLTSTNGTLLSQEMAQEILRSGLDKLIISFIGAGKGVYEGIMRGSNFQKVTDNITSFTKLKRKKSLRYPKIVLATGFLKLNINDLIKLPDVARELGIEEIEIGPFHSVDSYLPDLSEIKRVIYEIKKRASQKKIILNIQKDLFQRNYRAKQCIWPWQGVYITVKGDIKSCCSRAYFTKTSFGNIYEHNFNFVWHGTEYINFRKGLAGRGCLPVICRGCPWD